MEDPWKIYHNPIYSQNPNPPISSSLDLEDAMAMILDLKADLQFERGLREKTENHIKQISGELEKERRLREAAERATDELGVKALGHEAQIGSIMRAADEEKKMRLVAEVFREGKVVRTKEPGSGGSPASVGRRRSDSPENPHIKRGIRGSVEFQRVVKAMGSSNGNGKAEYKLECQKAQLKILLKQRCPVRPNSYFIS